MRETKAQTVAPMRLPSKKERKAKNNPQNYPVLRIFWCGQEDMNCYISGIIWNLRKCNC